MRQPLDSRVMASNKHRPPEAEAAALTLWGRCGEVLAEHQLHAEDTALIRRASCETSKHKL